MDTELWRFNLPVPAAEQTFAPDVWVGKRELFFEVGLFRIRRIRKPALVSCKVLLIQRVTICVTRPALVEALRQPIQYIEASQDAFGGALLERLASRRLEGVRSKPQTIEA